MDGLGSEPWRIIDDPGSMWDIPAGPRVTRAKRLGMWWMRRVRFRRVASGLRERVLGRYRMRMARRKQLMGWIHSGRVYWPSRVHEIDDPGPRIHNDMADALGYSMLWLKAREG